MKHPNLALAAVAVSNLSVPLRYAAIGAAVLDSGNTLINVAGLMALKAA